MDIIGKEVLLALVDLMEVNDFTLGIVFLLVKNRNVNPLLADV